MNYCRHIVIIALAVLLWSHVAALAAQGDTAAAYRLPVAQKADLQAALDAHKVVVLDSGDYSIPHATITLKSGYQLCGDPVGTRLPPVIVAPGTTGALLSTVVVGEGVTFPASAEVTTGNVIERLVGGINVTGGSLQDNLFLHIDGQIQIDNSAGGFMRNNRFIRCKTHAVWPQLTLLGDEGRNSYGNVFLWYNFLTPHGDATNITNQKDVTFVGFDAETWNERTAGPDSALIKTGPMGTLRVFGANGGNHGAHPTPAFDVAADEFQIYHNLMEHSRGGTADYRLRPSNQRSLHIGSAVSKRYDDQAKDAFRVHAFEAGNADFSINNEKLAPQRTLSPEQQSSLLAMISNERVGKPWEAPHHLPLPNPVGVGKLELSKQGDATDYIQGLIDKDGVARLPAGIYRISRPLKVKTNGGIIGAGAATTAIVANSNKLDMIVANDTDPRTHTGRRIIISGLTLQGGANGIHFEPVGTGTLTPDGKPIQAVRQDGTPEVDSQGKPRPVFAQYTACYFNDVSFRDMSVAGIFMDQIYALDNIFASHLSFVNCDTGWKQKVDPAYRSPGADGEKPTMMYMDKVLLYKCQFVGNRIAMDLPGNRGCNLNAWVNCRFENNREGVALMNNYATPMFANCDFINNGGDAAIRTNRPTFFVGCRFAAGASGRAMLDGPVAIEGCSFERRGSAQATILKPGSNEVFFSNCTSKDMPTGFSPKTRGMITNSVMANKGNFVLALIQGESVEPILQQKAKSQMPTPQLLFGSDWSDNDFLSAR